MFRLGVKKAAFKAVYEDARIPDLALYIKRVMSSCKTREQLENAYKWGKSAIDRIVRQTERTLKKKYDSIDSFLVVEKMTRSIPEDLLKHYLSLKNG